MMVHRRSGSVPRVSSDLELLASGNEADVYALDECRVLRRHRWMTDVSGQAELMAYVGSLGYPVPEVYAAPGTYGLTPTMA